MLCLSKFALAALSSLGIARYASFLCLAMTNLFCAYLSCYFSQVPYIPRFHPDWRPKAPTSSYNFVKLQSALRTLAVSHPHRSLPSVLLFFFIALSSLANQGVSVNHNYASCCFSSFSLCSSDRLSPSVNRKNVTLSASSTS